MDDSYNNQKRKKLSAINPKKHDTEVVWQGVDFNLPL